jgi:hypothetical protein
MTKGYRKVKLGQKIEGQVQDEKSQHNTIASRTKACKRVLTRQKIV